MSKANVFFPVLLSLLVIVGSFFYFRSSITTQPAEPQNNIVLLGSPTPTPSLNPSLSPSAPTQVLGVRTKTTGCIAVNGLPDPECSPGASFPDVTKEDVCTPGYSKKVRSVSTTVKNNVYKEYGITSHKTGEYEVDHIISLELGGSNDISNLYPEAAEPRPGYHEKDLVENYLHKQVCNGSITLEQAQNQISKNWLEVYKQISNKQL